jgi:hypothetical protein
MSKTVILSILISSLLIAGWAKPFMGMSIADKMTMSCHSTTDVVYDLCEQSFGHCCIFYALLPAFFQFFNDKLVNIYLPFKIDFSLIFLSLELKPPKFI